MKHCATCRCRPETPAEHTAECRAATLEHQRAWQDYYHADGTWTALEYAVTRRQAAEKDCDACQAGAGVRS